MRPKRVTVTGVGQSNPIPLNWRQNFNVSMAAQVVGTATYTVQHTTSNVLEGDAPIWYDHATMKNLTSDADGNYLFPVTAIRLLVTASTGAVNLDIVQQIR